jgi:hypothetical protein
LGALAEVVLDDGLIETGMAGPLMSFVGKFAFINFMEDKNKPLIVRIVKC